MHNISEPFRKQMIVLESNRLFEQYGYYGALQYIDDLLLVQEALWDKVPVHEMFELRRQSVKKYWTQVRECVELMHPEKSGNQ